MNIYFLEVVMKESLLSPHIHLTSAILTLADVVAAVGGLKGRSGTAGAAAKLHLRAGVGDAEHRAVPHVAAAETVEGSRPLGSRGRMLLLGCSRPNGNVLEQHRHDVHIRKCPEALGDY